MTPGDRYIIREESVERVGTRLGIDGQRSIVGIVGRIAVVHEVTRDAVVLLDEEDADLERSLYRVALVDAEAGSWCW